MTAWKVTLPGEEYLFEPDEMLGSEWGAVEAESGLTFDEWVNAIDARKWVPCQVLVWFLRQKAGRQEERRDVDFKIRQLRTEMIPDPKAPARTRASKPAGGSRSSKPTE